jgi:hypothetical protein
MLLLNLLDIASSPRRLTSKVTFKPQFVPIFVIPETIANRSNTAVSKYATSISSPPKKFIGKNLLTN